MHCAFASIGLLQQLSALGLLEPFACRYREQEGPGSYVSLGWVLAQDCVMQGIKAQPLYLSRDKLWGILYTPEFPAESGWRLGLTLNSCLASFPFLFCFPDSFTSFSWEHVLASYLHVSPHVSVCFWRNQSESVLLGGKCIYQNKRIGH